MLFSVSLIVFASIAPIEIGSICAAVKDWQTLITGGMAIIAALIAAHPVRKQLTIMAIQSSIMSRQVLSDRLLASQKRRSETKETIKSITQEFDRDFYFDEDAPSNPHWAFEAESKVRRAMEILLSQQRSKADSKEVEAARTSVIQAATALEECLYEIHAPYSGLLDDPEIALTEKERVEIFEKSELAPIALSNRITSLSLAMEALESSFLDDEEKMKSRIRSIDELILT